MKLLVAIMCSLALSASIALAQDEEAKFQALSKASSLRQEGHLVEAEGVLRRALNKLPTDQQLTLELAVTQSWNGDIQGAIETYDALVTMAPDNRNARIGAARVRGFAGELAEAEQRYNQLLTEDQSDVQSWNGLGQVLLSKNDRRSALNAFREALSLEADNAEALEGIKRAKNLIKGELRAAVGIVDGSLTAESSLWVTPVRRLRLIARWRTGGLTDRLSLETNHRVTLGFSYQGDHCSGGADYRVIVGETTQHAPEVSAACRAGDWTISGAVRPIISLGKLSAFQERLGVTRNIGRFAATLMVFRFDGFSNELSNTSSTAVALMGNYVTEKVSLNMAVSVGHLNDSLTVSGSVGVEYWLHPRFALNARAQIQGIELHYASFAGIGVRL